MPAITYLMRKTGRRPILVAQSVKITITTPAETLAALPEHSGAQKPKRRTIADWPDAAQRPVSVSIQENMEEPEWRGCSAAGPGSTSHRCSFRRFRISAPSRDSRNAGRTAARPADRRLAAQRSRGQPPPAIATRLFCPVSSCEDHQFQLQTFAAAFLLAVI